MGNEYIAEKRVEHSAVACEPDMIAPDPSKPMVLLPFVTYATFDTAVDTASHGNGNQYPLYISTSHVPHCLGGPPGGLGKTSKTWNGKFKTTENSSTVKVGPGWQIHHQHGGTINNGNAKAKVFTAVDAGSPAQKCLAMLRVQFERLKQGSKNQLSERPGGFVKDIGKGALDTVKGYGEMASDAGSSAASLFSLEGLKAAGRAIKQTAGSVMDAISGTVREVAEVGSAIVNDELSIDDIVDGMEDLAGELGEEALCALAAQMQEIADKPEAMGEALGGLMTEVAIQVAAALVSGGAANAAAAGAKAAKAAKAGGKAMDLGAGLAKKLKGMGLKEGDSFKDVIQKLKDRRRKGQDKTPDKAPAAPKPEAAAPNPPANRDSHNKGSADGEGEVCPLCPTTAHPVNPVLGCKVLAGEGELDFSLPGPLPLVWQRNYASNSRETGWFGQGWAVMFGMLLEESDNGEVMELVDTTGRRIRFPRVAPGRSFFSRYEQITLACSAAGEYSLVSGDGARLFFGQPHPQRPDQWLCSGLADANDNRIRLEYQPIAARPQDAKPALQAQPCYLMDSTGEALQLDYSPVGRLLRVSLLCGLSPNQGASGSAIAAEILNRKIADSVLARLEIARRDQTALQAQVLVEYRYNAEGDLVSVLRDGGEARRYQWRDHIMVGHTVPGALQAHYEYDRYDAGGKVIRHWSNVGQQWNFEYSSGHTKVVEAKGTAVERATLYHFDEKRRWTGLTDALGGRTIFELNQYGHRVATIDPDGTATRYSLDGKGRPLAVTDALGHSTQVLWHSELELPTQLIDALGQATSLEYDARGNLIGQIDPAGNATRFELDARGLPVRIIDAKGGNKRLEWDARAQLIAYTDCSQQTTRFCYNERGWLSSQTDALGATTSYHYDPAGRVQSIDYPDGGSERFEYDPAGRLVAHIDALGNRTRYELDADNQPTARIDALGGRLEYRYDPHRRLIGLINQNGTPWQFQYDALDRLVAETNFEGKFSAYAYSAAGQLMAQRELPASHPDSILTRFERDALGQLLARHTQASGQALQRTRYQYDPAGQLSRTSNADAAIEFGYDPLGNLLQEIHTTHWRDEQGKRQPRVQQLSHQYDPLGNRIASTLPDGRTLNWLMYGSGHLHQINLDGELIADIERDAMHREVARSQGSLHSQFQLDAMGRLVDHRVSARSLGQQPQVGVGVQHGSRIARHWRYDRAGQVLEINDARKGRTEYHYDALSRIRSTIGPKLAEQFEFDPAHNLLPANGHSPLKDNRVTVFEDKRYRYDSHGRLVEKRSGSSQNSTVLQLEWNAEHQLVKATTTRSKGAGQANRVSETYYGYDALGRRMSRQSREWIAPAGQTDTPAHTTPGNSAWFLWDGNRLLQEILVSPNAADPAQRSQTHTTVYEPDSFIPLARLSWTTSAKDTALAPPQPADWMAQRMAFFDQAQATYSAQHGLVPDDDDFLLQVAQANAGQPAEPNNPVAITWYQCDHLGTPQELTSANGDIVWQASYKTWGNTATVEWVAADGAVQAQQSHAAAVEHAQVQPLRFQGQYFDAETGLHYNRFRYYDPDVGRFVSNDPIGLAGGDNVYQYAPNPISWIDPLGLAKCPCDCLKKGNQQGTGPYRGGSYGGTTAPGIESHHAPANSVSPLAKSQGPAIQMAPADHAKTMSHGHQGNAGKAYRSGIQAMLDAGDWRGAMATELKDIRRVAAQTGNPRKYNEAMQEMLAYAKCKGLLDKK
ncbi:RHS repeat protein [Chitinimonas arctica]|uniref:RHS repeat protein n=1 Tax=Chitinimonas arctica TaxID=2594795 RepID=A0A516SL73_9NEIS|nr:RHS repeat-associated core domain-containing protein [Chitinimonas arctica]QDQ28896.1 RHS repeat protein [Chitinimonas arctica]